MERKVIIISGPTCTGKTRLALLLAEKLNTEIISADSRQIYKYLDIGTAKPSESELKKIKHHFINILEPDEDYNVSRFEKDSLAVIRQMLQRNKIPIVAGGSGLYIKAIVSGIFDTADTDEEFRTQLKNLHEKHGSSYLYEQLKKVDPVSASKMLPQNWKRVMRALEVIHLTGKPIWQHQQEYKREIDLTFLQYGLLWNRVSLYKNIERRVDKMIEDGLVEEVKNILSRGYSKDLNSLNTVGYKEIIAFLDDQVTLQRAVELIKRNSRRYAKRQITWFNEKKDIVWYTIDEKTSFERLADNIIKKL